MFAALALAYRTRPVFVPTTGPNDPVARYRTAVMTRLRLFGIGVPALIGVFAGLVAQSYWVRVQLFLHGGSFGVTDPQFGKDLGFYAFDLPFYRLVLSYPVRARCSWRSSRTCWGTTSSAASGWPAGRAH